jgi:chromosomal replication initiation ATPase DnaA
MSGSALQLALDLPHAASFRRDDFLPSPANEAALALIDAWPRWPHRVAAIVGPAGSGKSHLAAIWAERAGARIEAARALGRADVPRLATGALALEDVEPGGIDEAALFHLLNLAKEEDCYVLLTAARRLDAGFTVADLASRLRAVPVIALCAPDDALLAAVLVKLFADRQLAVGEGVVNYLVPRMERSLAAVRALVARLDRAALSRGRAVTRQLAAEMVDSPDTSL